MICTKLITCLCDSAGVEDNLGPRNNEGKAIEYDDACNLRGLFEAYCKSQAAGGTLKETDEGRPSR